MCSYVGIHKIGGVYQLEDFKKIKQKLQTDCYFKDDEIEIIKIKFEQKIEQQKKEQHIKINEMYERLKQSYYDNINNQNFVEDYYDVKYNKLMPENIIRERMDEIYNNTFWKDIALEPPY